MTAFRVQAKRTTASGPPADLEFGELAYSDADQQFYVGRPAPAAPVTFKGDITPVDLAPVNASIAAIETEQGTQNEAIALLNAASDSQADAIGLLATTTSLNVDAIALINTEQDSQDAAIAALAAASSGQADAIDSLAARPLTYGVTYDQQDEPVSPAAGATWRERSAGGLIVGEWEWSGSLWLSGERSATLYSGASASANTANTMGIYPRFPSLLTGYSAIFVQPFAPQDSSNHWLFRHRGLGISQWLTTIDQSTTTPTALRLALESPVIIPNPSNIDNFASKVGTPGNLRAFRVITHYKLIRA